MAYEFDPSDVQVVTELLEEATKLSDELLKGWTQVASNDKYQLLSESLRAEFDFAFTHELEEDFETAGEVKLVQSGLSVTATRPMSETPSGAWTLWGEVFDALKPSIVRAHLADLLLTSRIRARPAHAAVTIASYMEVPDIDGVTAQQSALSLARANAIARSRRMTEEEPVRQAMYAKSEVFSSNLETMGPALTLLAALSVPPRSGEILDEERKVMRSQLLSIGEAATFFTDEVAKTLFRLSNEPTELEAARRWHTEQYLNRAENEDHGMVKMHHAQTAVNLANDYGLSELRDAAVIVMQSIDQATMGWESVYYEGKLSKNAFRAHLRKYARARSWNHALMTFLAGPSPSGDHEANKRTAGRAARGSIRSLVTRTSYGAHGLPERTNEDFTNEEITRTETINLSTTSILLALELEHIRARFSAPDVEQVALWMVETLSADGSLSHYFAQSLNLHWDQRYSDSARLCIPLIESAARGLLRALDEPLYRTQRGDSPGRFPAMDFYVDALAKRDLDPNWVRAFRMTLLTPGLNLRNLSAHGFLMDFTEQQSALLLRLAGLLCAMPINTAHQSLEALPRMAQRRLRRRLGWVWS